MTFDEFKEEIRRRTGSQKHVDSLLRNTGYSYCLVVCKSNNQTWWALSEIALWHETEEGRGFWIRVYETLFGMALGII